MSEQAEGALSVPSTSGGRATAVTIVAALAVLARGYLAVHFWQWAVLVGLVGLAALLIVERIRELRA